ncbi:MAG: 3-deoxy-D-manno-octulosonic acid transferase [Mariprofundaceae bacterium]|nr:3-deoxy-D-manno-octulosonic acid transferase [Mariprofundaceae bacterium]
MKHGPGINAGACFFCLLARYALSCCNTAMHGISKWRQHLTLDLPDTGDRPVWLHACSVGEVASVAPLVEELIRLTLPVHLSVMTKTGFTHASRLFDHRTGISYLPWDIPGLMQRFILRLSPRILLLTETEFWPGMLSACNRRHIPVIGINTRISDRSFPRYRTSRLLWRRWLSPVSLFLAQSELDAERLAMIGVHPERIQVAGNLKYTISAPATNADGLRRRFDTGMSRPILLAASTHEGEEEMLFAMWPEWKRLQPDLLLLLVPRHPERFDDVAEMLKQRGIRFSRWSDKELAGQSEMVLIDAMGVLTQLYAIADIVIIGGSLVSIGGHNPLEAAICGRGVITGPYVQNFRGVMRDMQRANAAVVAEDAPALNETIRHFLQHPDDLKHLNAHAAVLMQDNARVLEQIMDALSPFLDIMPALRGRHDV